MARAQEERKAEERGRKHGEAEWVQFCIELAWKAQLKDVWRKTRKKLEEQANQQQTNLTLREEGTWHGCEVGREEETWRVRGLRLFSVSYLCYFSSQNLMSPDIISHIHLFIYLTPIFPSLENKLHKGGTLYSLSEQRLTHTGNSILGNKFMDEREAWNVTCTVEEWKQKGPLSLAGRRYWSGSLFGSLIIIKVEIEGQRNRRKESR